MVALLLEGWNSPSVERVLCEKLGETTSCFGPGQLTNRHRHTYETVLHVIEGAGFTEIEDQKVEWQAGDAVYIPSWAWPRHQNTSDSQSAKYIACENASQLQNLGVALREEEGRDL